MLKKIPLHFQILIALLLSVFMGMYFPAYVVYVEWMGVLFLRALRMIIVPLIMASIITGVMGMGKVGNLGRIGIKTFAYYFLSSLLAVLTGLLIVNVIQPGMGADLGLQATVDNLPVGDRFGQTLLKIIPVNIVEAMVKGDMLAIIFFALLFGFFALRVETRYTEGLRQFFHAIFEVMLQITLFVIRFSPLGIFGIVSALVASHTSNPQALLGMLQSLGLYMLCVVLALFIHGLITLPFMVRLLGRSNPWKHFRNMSVPLLTAFSTSSSNATLPLTLETVERKSGVSNQTSGFVIPLGATINMDGTALYECIAAMFIAQAYGIELTLVQQFVVVFTALLASVGAAGIPMAGLVVITIILSAVGLPLEGVGLIVAVDRILDMFRTTVNVWSDSCGAVIIARSEGEVLKV